MRFRTGTPRVRLLAFVLLLIAACATTAHADVVSAGAGKGLLFSKDYGGWFLHYYHDAPTQSCGPCFLELTAGTWPGEAAATIVAASAGWRATFGEHDFVRASLGGGYLNRTTEHLGTHGQFMIQLLAGRTFGEYDLGAGLTHVSNGDFVLQTGKPNDGENFLTVELGRRF
jgi:hypothetical protein